MSLIKKVVKVRIKVLAAAKAEFISLITTRYLFVFAGSVSHFLGHLQLPRLLRLFRVGVVVRLDEHEGGGVVVENELARGEVERVGGLVEDGAELFEGQDSKRVR